MTEELFAYLMDDLPAECRANVEAKIAADPAWQKELERLRECLATSNEPCQCIEEEPPADLVQRTCGLVEKISDHSGALSPVPTKTRRAAAFTAASPCLGRHSRWSVADITVGSAVALMVAALIFPAVFETRSAARRLTCQENLKTFGQALYQYQDARNHQLPPVEPGESAGMYAMKLRDSGVITGEQLAQILVCPESQLADDVFAGRLAVTLPRREQLQKVSGADRKALLKLIGGSYAYRMGYYDDDGVYRQLPYTAQPRSPLMGDAPLVSGDGLRSANHNGNGLNIVDQNLRVRYQAECTLDNDNVYTNDEGQQAAGLDADDIVLGPSDITPDGPIFQLAPAR
jgi:hypothetical protein